MEQNKIWDYLQNEGLEQGAFASYRYHYVVNLLKKKEKVLNVGIGSGKLEKLSLEKEIDIHSLDPSERAIFRSRELLNLDDKRLKIGYIQKIPFENGKFDTVVVSEVLEHLDDEVLDKGLSEINRVLKKDGKIIVTTPFNEPLLENTFICPNCGQRFHKFGHVRSFDKEKMQYILMKHQFHIKEIYVTSFVNWKRKGIFNFIKSLIRLFLAKMGQWIASPSLIAIAQKK